MIASTTFIFNSVHHSPDKEKLHGREWEVIIGVEGDELDGNGFLFDFRILKQIWKEMIEPYVDGKKLNDIIPNPTAENIVYWMGKIIITELDTVPNLDAIHIELKEGYRGSVKETFKF